MTPLDQIIIEDQKYLLKREDTNLTGSHKDRGLYKQIEQHMANDVNSFVISSSGNSAISAAAKCRSENLQLTIFISEKISAHKLLRLSDAMGKEILRGVSTTTGKTSIKFSKRAISDAHRFSTENNAINLRGSVDPFAWEGYTEIAYELLTQEGAITDIFIPSSSGTSAYGIYKGYKAKAEENDSKIPCFHICQSSAVHTLVKDLTNSLESQNDHSIVDSIVDRVGHRREQILQIIDQTEGRGWIISDNEILDAESKSSIMKNFSYEASLALAAAIDHSREKESPFLPLILVSSVR